MKYLLSTKFVFIIDCIDHYLILNPYISSFIIFAWAPSNSEYFNFLFFNSSKIWICNVFFSSFFLPSLKLRCSCRVFQHGFTMSKLESLASSIVDGASVVKGRMWYYRHSKHFVGACAYQRRSVFPRFYRFSWPFFPCETGTRCDALPHDVVNEFQQF